MDLWVIAATAVTGYVAQCLQNISKGNEKLPESPSKDFSSAKTGSPRCPFSRLIRGKKQKEDSCGVRRTMADEENLDLWELEGTFGMEVPSTSGESLGNNNSATSHSLSSLVPKFAGSGHGGDTETCSSHNSFRTRTFLRGKRRYRRLIKPLSSIETCLMAQFHDEQMTLEDHMLSPFPSPCASFTRPLLVTDGTQVISRYVGDSLTWQIQNEDESAHVHGIPLLPELKSSVASNRMRSRIGERANRGHVRVHGGNFLDTFKTEDLLILEKEKALNVSPSSGFSGSFDAAVLLCLGIFIGLTSSCIAGKKELEKLKQELNQTENLVQDLQDELEMKDSLTVKELQNENMETQKNDKLQCDQEAGESSESMRKIEAELEAELERLEINICTSNIETGLSDVIEMEPGYIADFAQGELRVEDIKGISFDQTESNQDPSGKSTPESANYAVSPRELSLRLHEVINAQLKGRIKELERALQESQRKVELLMGSESKRNPWTKLWENGELMRELMDNNPMETQPLVMNLAGEALNAYNEAYEELMKVNDDSEDDDNSPSQMHVNWLHKGEECIEKKNAPLGSESYMNGPSRTGEDVNLLRVQELPDVVGLSDKEEEEETSGFEDEMEKQLIKQIVEKTRQGSPVVLNAQKMLFLMDR